MKVLVTGAAGFIGSHLVERFLSRGFEILGVDDFNDFYDPALKRENLASAIRSSGFRLAEGDIRDGSLMSRLVEDFGPDLVVHFAARAGVRHSIEAPVLYEEVNVGGTQVLLEAARRAGVRRFLFASSSSVYGEGSKVPFAESDPAVLPLSPYAATKRAGELLGHAYWHLYGIAFWALRFFTVYGPRQRPEMAIHKFARLIDAGEEVPQFGDGTSRRDYTYIDDILDAIEASAARIDGFEILNLGESRTTTLADLITMIERGLGRKARVRRLPPQAGDMTATWADISRAAARIGYAPKFPVEEGMPLFLEWFRRTRRHA